jgi:hypothetical protein
VREAMKHPAKFTEGMVPYFKKILDAELGGYTEQPLLVLDPFAGTGRIHDLDPDCERYVTVGLEIEPEWANMHPRTVRGDATGMHPSWSGKFHAVVTSPTYGNRMADHHNARDGSKRMTYRHVLGRELHPHNTGAMQWGPQYRAMHVAAWAEVTRVTRPAAVLVLNMSDHIRKGEVVPVTQWHRDTLATLGWRLTNSIEIETPRMGFGANYKSRVPFETIDTFRRDNLP